MEGHPDWDAQFTVPPVHHTLFLSIMACVIKGEPIPIREAEDWVRWVDNNGHWIRKAK